MPALVLVEVEIHNPELYEEYKKHTLATISKFGGRFVVRGAKTESLEGDWNPGRLVILEFPSVQVAKDWWNSPEYTLAKNIRYQAARSKMLVVECNGEIGVN
ncbi:DUF1330 domain-containing protein [Cecembia calidifontis]|jgi:uncharacterized protein (DUF1330 family)|uniref:Uncharacterized protein (DUF1330 family) n=1 Tax=Cecembia calidifontis TaxID=1187080 RepID=A0A4Q7PCB5_9BACT|nr:DUF1330 domain-containing protein [Cecembia calidifontis]RZS97667.1 uncharacterized protein (DUF1330 family) [Cecembia calidifontis]